MTRSISIAVVVGAVLAGWLGCHQSAPATVAGAGTAGAASGSAAGPGSAADPNTGATTYGGHQVQYIPSAAGETVQVVVRDHASKEPLSGVTVVLAAAGGAATGGNATGGNATGGNATGGDAVVQETAITDERGGAAVRAAPGLYTLTVYYGDLVYAAAVEVQAQKTARVSVALKLAPGGEVVRVAEPPRPTFTDALSAIKRGAVPEAIAIAQKELAQKDTATGHAILAIARYGAAAEGLQLTWRALRSGKDTADSVTQARRGLEQFVAALDEVQLQLAAAAKDPAFALELCVACMADEHGLFPVPTGLLDIERDRAGKALPAGDPRRRPTIRFDHGDLAWGAAIVAFQQAAGNLLLAYDWSWIAALDATPDDQLDGKVVTVKLAEPARIARAREQILAGLAASDACRKEFLAETDDDREWVPSPTQNSYASPLPVDAALYATWAAIIGDVRALVQGRTGLSLRGLMRLVEPREAASVPAAFLDIGAMLSKPKDIVFTLGLFDAIENAKQPAARAKLVERALRQLVGNGYKTTMTASPITTRLTALRAELDKNEDALEDKLKYFFWLN